MLLALKSFFPICENSLECMDYVQSQIIQLEKDQRENFANDLIGL